MKFLVSLVISIVLTLMIAFPLVSSCSTSLATPGGTYENPQYSWLPRVEGVDYTNHNAEKGYLVVGLIGSWLIFFVLSVAIIGLPSSIGSTAFPGGGSYYGGSYCGSSSHKSSNKRRSERRKRSSKTFFSRGHDGGVYQEIKTSNDGKYSIITPRGKNPSNLTRVYRNSDGREVTDPLENWESHFSDDD